MKKKILHIVTRLEKGGTLENILSLLKATSRKYKIVLVLGTKTSAIEEISKMADTAQFKVRYVEELERKPNLIKDMAALIKIRSIIKEEKPDLIHTHTSKAGILGRVAASITGFKNVVHTPHGHIFYGYFGKIQTWFFCSIERFCAPLAKRIVVFSKCEKEDNLAKKIGKETQYEIIPHGIDINKYSKAKPLNNGFKDEIRITRKDKVIAVIGRLAPVKGHKYLLLAFKEVLKESGNLKLLLIGDGELKDKLKQLALELGILRSVVFTGNRTDVPRILKITDLLVVPSLNEAFGLVIAESFAAGVPVIASKVGGIPEIIKDGINGTLVPAKDVFALTAGIVKYLRNKRLVRKYVANGRIAVKKEFDISIMIKRYINLYEKMLSN